MRDTDYNKILEFTPAGGGMLPGNQQAVELLDNATPGEVFSFLEVGARDINLHRAYF